MDSPDRAHPGTLWILARAKLAFAAPVGLVLVASADRHLNRPGPLAAIALVPVIGAVVTRRLPANRTLALVGGAVAATAAWLLGQRDDLVGALILAALFAIGLGLAVEAPRPTRTTAVTTGAAIASLVILRLVLPESVMVAIVVVLALAAGISTAIGRLPTRTTTRVRALTFGTVLVATMLIFTGYIGAETPDVTWFGGGAVHGPTNTGEVALTFDDGPNVGASEKVMAILDANGIKGTFFEVGKAIDADPQITRALYDDGQLLGNHSYDHDQWRWLDPRYPELQRTQDAFKRAIGTCPVLYRPPHGDRTPFLARVVRDHHMHMVLWSASAGDWATNDAQLVARRILAGARPGAILLLHDGLDGKPLENRQVLVRALPLVIAGLRAKGLTPVRLDRLLGTAAYQPC